MIKSILLLLVTTSFVLASCEKEHGHCRKHCTEAEGTVVNLTGKLDGCAILIVLPNGDKLEPIKSPSNFTYVDGKKVSFCYEEKSVGSICMSGQTVIIKSIEYTD